MADGDRSVGFSCLRNSYMSSAICACREVPSPLPIIGKISTLRNSEKRNFLCRRDERWRWTYTKRQWLVGREERSPDVRESSHNSRVMRSRVEQQKAVQELLQIFFLVHLVLNNHFGHRAPEVGVRILRSLHHREALHHFSLRQLQQWLLPQSPQHRLDRRSAGVSFLFFADVGPRLLPCAATKVEGREEIISLERWIDLLALTRFGACDNVPFLLRLPEIGQRCIFEGSRRRAAAAAVVLVLAAAGIERRHSPRNADT